MYNQGNMCLHVDLFIKYVSNNVYSDNNHGQPQSILNIFLTFFSSLYIMTTFCGLFSVRYCFFFTLSGAQRWAEREMGNTKKNTITLMNNQIWPILVHIYPLIYINLHVKYVN